MAGQIIRIVLAGAFFFILGLLANYANPSIDRGFDALGRDMRLALGFPKFWSDVDKAERRKERMRAECPAPENAIVILTGGAGNAANTNSQRSSTLDGGGVYTVYKDGCYVTQDPVLGATGWRGSLWPPLGAALVQSLGRPVLFVHTAVGDSEIGDWIDRRSGYFGALEDRIEDAERLGYDIDLVLWHQGENDAPHARDVDAVRAALDDLTKDLLAAAPRATLYLFQTTVCGAVRSREGAVAVKAAQQVVAETNNRIVLGLDTDTLDADFRRDGCHFNSLGKAAIIERLAPELQRLALERGF